MPDTKSYIDCYPHISSCEELPINNPVFICHINILSNPVYSALYRLCSIQAFGDLP